MSKTSVSTLNNSPAKIQECAEWLFDYLMAFHSDVEIVTHERMIIEYKTDLFRYSLFYFTGEGYVHFYMTELDKASSILSFPMPRYERDFLKIMQILDVK